MPFPFCPRSSRRQAPRALRERLERSEGGNTGRRTAGPCRAARNGAAVRSAPGRGRAEGGLIRARRAQRQAGSGRTSPALGLLDQFSKPHRKLDALADLFRACALGGRWGFAADLTQTGEQRVKVLAQKPLAECGIASRTGQVGVGNRRKRAHDDGVRASGSVKVTGSGLSLSYPVRLP
jgi:hypothetical protein